MQKVKFILFLLIFFKISSAQSIEGVLINNQAEPLAYAVVVLNTIDSQFVSGETSNEQGRFRFKNIEIGKYSLTIKMIGYESISRDLDLGNTTLILDPITLNTDAVELSEVDVVAKKPIFESQADRTIVNVKNAISSAGSNALEILERSPGIQIDRLSNRITMLGKNGIIILINGKRSRLEADALIQMLNSTSSNSIEKIELIHNPPSSYDAEGNGGVINIIMDMEYLDGLNGNTNLFIGYGERPKYGASINLNYQKGRANIYLNLNTNNDFSQQDLTLNQRIQYENDFIDTRQQNTRPPYTGNHGGKIGLDYNLNKSLSLNSFFSYSLRDWRMKANSVTDFINPSSEVLQEILGSDEINQTKHYIISNQLNYTISDKLSLVLNYDYLSYQISNPTSYNNLKFGNNQSEVLNTSFESKKETPFNFHVLQMDLKQSLNENFSFEYGLKTTLSNITNDTELSYLSPTQYTDEFFTNILGLNEDIYAAYILSNGNLKNDLNFNLGLRYEQTELNLSSSNDGETLNRSRKNIFPSISINKKWKEKYSLGLSYNRRINRPGFQTLAPAFYFLDNNTVLTGNINAIPSLTSTYGINIGLSSLKINLSYANEKDPLAFGQPELNQSRNLLMLRPLNIDRRQVYNLNISFPINITSFWTSRYNVNMTRRIENGILQGNAINNVKGNFITGNTNHSFKLGKQWEAEVSATWNSKVKMGLAEFQDRFAINLGLQKSFKNNSKLSLSISDIFNTGSEFGLISNQPDLGIYYNWVYQLEGKVFRLSYNLPFGNQKIKDKSKRSAGSDDIQNRASN
jgi:hypothetical protein